MLTCIMWVTHNPIGDAQRWASCAAYALTALTWFDSARRLLNDSKKPTPLADLGWKINENAVAKGFYPLQLTEDQVVSRVCSLRGAPASWSEAEIIEVARETAHIARKTVPRNGGELLALITSEVSEWLEAMRHGNPPSEHIPEFSSEEEEAADILIRTLDTAVVRGLRIDEAVEAKMKFNASRPHKHGGKKF